MLEIEHRKADVMSNADADTFEVLQDGELIGMFFTRSDAELFVRAKEQEAIGAALIKPPLGKPPVFCDACHYRNRDDARFCGGCGKMVSAKVETQFIPAMTHTTVKYHDGYQDVLCNVWFPVAGSRAMVCDDGMIILLPGHYRIDFSGPATTTFPEGVEDMEAFVKLPEGQAAILAATEGPLVAIGDPTACEIVSDRISKIDPAFFDVQPDVVIQK
jgi:hypothetical protein